MAHGFDPLVPSPRYKPSPKPGSWLVRSAKRWTDRQYQVDGIHFLADHARAGALLADELGLGKTCQAILAATLARATRVLVVCPNAVKLNWACREIPKWCADPTIYIGEGGKTPIYRDIALKKLQSPKIDGPCWLVLNYDILLAWMSRAAIEKWKPFDLVIFDEVHFGQSPKSRRSKGMRLARARSTLAIGLTGTPLTNRPKDLWNVVDVLSPGRFGPFFPFALRYCAAFQKHIIGQTDAKVVWDYSGASNQKELHRRLEHFMLRRTVEGVHMELPQRSRQIIELEVPRAAQQPYTVNTLRDSKALRSILDVAADAKLPRALELVLEHASAGHNVVAFTHRRLVAEQVVDAAAAANLSTELIYGGVPLKERALRIARKPSVLACTIESCSTGIDLTFADVGVFLELVYKPHELIQAEGRLARFGQQRPTLFQYVVAVGTLDELIASSVIAKIDTTTEVIGNPGAAENLREDLSNRGCEDPLAKLVEDYEKRYTGVNHDQSIYIHFRT